MGLAGNVKADDAAKKAIHLPCEINSASHNDLKNTLMKKMTITGTRNGLEIYHQKLPISENL